MPKSIPATVMDTNSSISVKPCDRGFMGRHSREASLLEPDMREAVSENAT
jgi:hypothetical protein